MQTNCRLPKMATTGYVHDLLYYALQYVSMSSMTWWARKHNLPKVHIHLDRKQPFYIWSDRDILAFIIERLLKRGDYESWRFVAEPYGPAAVVFHNKRHVRRTAERGE